MTNLQPLEQLIKSLQSLDVKAEVVEIIDANNEVLVEMEREQLIAGKHREGKPRIDEYRPFTKAYKRMVGVGAGAIIDRVTFYMTGNLSQSLYYSRNGDNYSIISSLETYGKMIERIGPNEYGLDPENRLFFAKNVTLPEFKKVFKAKTGLSI
jgi:hypothetical protein